MQHASVSYKVAHLEPSYIIMSRITTHATVQRTATGVFRAAVLPFEVLCYRKEVLEDCVHSLRPACSLELTYTFSTRIIATHASTKDRSAWSGWTALKS